LPRLALQAVRSAIRLARAQSCQWRMAPTSAALPWSADIKRGRVCPRHPLFAASAVRDEDGNRSQLAGDCWCVWFDRPLTTWRTSPRSNRNNSLPRPLRRAQCRNMKSQCSSMSHRAKALIWPIPGEPQLCKAQELLQFAKEIDPGVGQPKSGSAYKTISYAILPPSAQPLRKGGLPESWQRRLMDDCCD